MKDSNKTTSQVAEQNNQQSATTPVANTQTMVVQEKKSNGIGTAGFVLSIISLFISWVPAINFIVWFLGALFSFIGLFKSPRGLAIAGFIISFIDIFIILLILGGLAAMLAS